MFMPPHIAQVFAADHGRELRQRAQAKRIARRPSRRAPRVRSLRTRGEAPLVLENDVTIRLARPDDEPQLRRLAELDSRGAPQGELLVALVGDQLSAALPLDGRRPIADPFRLTDGLITLLRVRAEQLRAAEGQLAPAARNLATRRRPAVAGDR